MPGNAALVLITLGAASCGNPGQDPLALAPITLEVSTQSLPDGRVGQTYAATLTAFGGTGGYTWSLIDGELPAGISLDAGGSLAGTPTDAGTSAFMVQVVSADNQNATRQLTIEITP